MYRANAKPITPEGQPVHLGELLRQIADRRGLTLPENSQSSTPISSQPSTATTRPGSTPTAHSCPQCGGLGHYVPDVPPGQPGFGKSVRCNRCDTGLGARSGLNEQELRTTAASIRGDNDMVTLLRWLVGDVLAHPTGWLTLYGSYGTAKTLTAQAIVAGMIRQNTPARFYHARQLEQGWFDDVHADSANGQLYRDIPVLCIDEVDKINLASAWVRAGFQELMDTRYRSGLAGRTLTVLICQVEPSEVMPGDVYSRMADGRFWRQWTGKPSTQTGKPNQCTVEQWGARYVPGIVHVTGADVRPLMRPAPRQQVRA